MMELQIKGQAYQFKFGFGFMREIDKRQIVKAPNGTQQNIGFQTAVGGILDGDAQALEDVLLLANKGQEPRLTADVLEEYIEDEETDVDALFNGVIDFLKKSNVSKKKTLNLLKQAEAMGLISQ
jgi:hypothetical protein